MTLEEQLSSGLDRVADVVRTPAGLEDRIFHLVDRRRRRRQLATGLAAVVATVMVMTVGLAVRSKRSEPFVPAADSEPYLVLDGAGFPTETYTVTAFRRQGQDCVQARSAITTAPACLSADQSDALARDERLSVFGAIAMPDYTQLLLYGSLSPHVKEIVVRYRSGETRTIKPVASRTAGTRLPVIAVYVPDQHEIVDISGRRTDGTDISPSELRRDPEQEKLCIEHDAAGRCVRFGSTPPTGP